ncbi:ABC transporter permease, partial [Glutamicibacter sp.]
MTRIYKHRLFWPLVALAALLLACTIKRPDILGITVLDGHLFGAPIDILRNSAPLLLVSLGMTLVIATRGIDLSVGATVAIAGAVALTFIASSDHPASVGTALGAIIVALGLCFILGCFNGMLVANFGIQPIIATLILMTAGRGVAMLIT